MKSLPLLLFCHRVQRDLAFELRVFDIVTELRLALLCIY